MEALYLLSYGSIKMAPQVGFEPTTNRLTADCSTTELLWNHRNEIILLNHCIKIYYHTFYVKSNKNAWQRPTLAGAMPQLPSALKSLTSVFGMGTGVASSLSSPDKFVCVNTYLTIRFLRIIP